MGAKTFMHVAFSVYNNLSDRNLSGHSICGLTSIREVLSLLWVLGWSYTIAGVLIASTSTNHSFLLWHAVFKQNETGCTNFLLGLSCCRFSCCNWDVWCDHGDWQCISWCYNCIQPITIKAYHLLPDVLNSLSIFIMSSTPSPYSSCPQLPLCIHQESVSLSDPPSLSDAELVSLSDPPSLSDVESVSSSWQRRSDDKLLRL